MNKDLFISRLCRGALAALVFAGVAGMSPGALAQTPAYPTKAIHLVVPYAPGGGTDVLGRLLASKMTEGLGQPVIVDNKPGANSIIGATFAAKAPPDGYTLLVGAVGTVAVNPAVYTDLTYSMQKDFAPISMAAVSPMTLIVPASLPVTDVKQLLAYLRSNPEKANYAASGTPFQLMAELFAQRTGLKLTTVNYKGTGDSVNAVVSGQVTMSFVDSAPVVSLAKAGRIRVLAVTSPQRHPSFPDTPTLIESGVLDREVQLWSGIYAPAGTPPGIVNRLSQEFRRIAALPDVREKLGAVGIEPVGSTPEALRSLNDRDIKMWTDVAGNANIKLSRQ